MRPSLPSLSAAMVVALAGCASGFDRLGPFTVELSDIGASVAMVQDMGSMLQAEPILAPGEAVHVGQLLRLAVGPGFDRVRWQSTAFITVRNGNELLSESVSIAPPSEDGVLEVQLPSTLPAGVTHVEVGVNVLPRITRCEGAGACSIPSSMSVTFNTELDVVP